MCLCHRIARVRGGVFQVAVQEINITSMGISAVRKLLNVINSRDLRWQIEDYVVKSEN